MNEKSKLDQRRNTRNKAVKASLERLDKAVQYNTSHWPPTRVQVRAGFSKVKVRITGLNGITYISKTPASNLDLEIVKLFVPRRGPLICVLTKYDRVNDIALFTELTPVQLDTLKKRLKEGNT